MPRYYSTLAQRGSKVAQKRALIPLELVMPLQQGFWARHRWDRPEVENGCSDVLYPSTQSNMHTASATAPSLSDRRRDRRFYLLIAVLIASLVFVGFAPTFYLNNRFHRFPLSGLHILHGTVFSSWIALLILQSGLIYARRVRVHRTLGYAAIALVVLMVFLGVTIAISGVRRGVTPPGAPPPLVFFAIPFFDVIVFAAVVGAAFWYRNRPETHKRLMIVATLAILPAASARIFVNLHASAPILESYAVSALILLGCMVYDYATRRRVYPGYLWGGLFFVTSVPLRLYIAGTHAWLSFAHWITRT